MLVGDERVSVQGLSNFATIRATACVYAGKWMFEVQLGTKGIMQVSFLIYGIAINSKILYNLSSCIGSLSFGSGGN